MSALGLLVGAGGATPLARLVTPALAAVAEKCGDGAVRRTFLTSAACNDTESPSSSSSDSSPADEAGASSAPDAELAAELAALGDSLRGTPAPEHGEDSEAATHAKQLDYKLATEEHATMARVDAIAKGTGVTRAAVLAALQAMPNDAVRANGKVLTKLDVFEAAHVVFNAAVAETAGTRPAFADDALRERGCAVLGALDTLSATSAADLSEDDKADTVDALASLHPLYKPLPTTASGHAKKTRQSQHGSYLDGDSFSDFIMRDDDADANATPMPSPSALAAAKGGTLTAGEAAALAAQGALPDRLAALARARSVSLASYVDRVVFPHLAAAPHEGVLYDLEDAVQDDPRTTTRRGRPSSATAQYAELAAVPGWRDRLERLAAAPLDAHATAPTSIFRWSQRFVIHAGPRDYHPANRKAKLQVYLSDLAEAYSLSDDAARHVAWVAGTRYNRRTGELTFSCEDYFDREDNRRRCLQWVVALVQEGHTKFPSDVSQQIIPRLGDDAFHRTAAMRAAPAPSAAGL